MNISPAKLGHMPLLTVQLRQEQDVVAARQRARQLASLIGFGHQDQVRIATVVSEIARNAYQYARGGRVEFALLLSPNPQALAVTVVDNGPGIEDLDAILAGRRQSRTGMGMGLTGSRRLMDTFEIQSQAGIGTRIHFSKSLPPEAPRLEGSRVSALVSRLAQESSAPVDDAQNQHRDLLETLQSLRSRELELEKRQLEMRHINAELAETNSGVVALYAELDEKALALRRADELKSHFLRHVSHEFRTPLNSILALAQLLLRRIDGDLTTEQERQIGFIRQAAQDLTEIVNDLLDLAKVESGKVDVRITRIHLAQLFGGLRGIMRPLVVSDAVSLVFDEPGPGLSLLSDESKIAQILRNLVSNALKFTERGEVRVSFHVSDGSLELRVSDTGIGIAPADQERIFHEFAQVDSAMQGRVKGTGLGLPLSRKLATLLGGELTVSSERGRGSTFLLRIPMDGHTGGLMHDIVDGSDAVLIIDDEESARYIAKQHFRGSRHRLIEAANGIEGAERARFERPKLILLDLAMPDRSGFDVLDDLKSDAATSSIPVLIHTSRQFRQSDYERLANRHVGILPKGEAWPAAALEYMRTVLDEPELFTPGMHAGRAEKP
jgi:signal transduction histidine kinase/CheY-like chemotaxis protein